MGNKYRTGWPCTHRKAGRTNLNNPSYGSIEEAAYDFEQRWKAFVAGKNAIEIVGNQCDQQYAYCAQQVITALNSPDPAHLESIIFPLRRMSVDNGWAFNQKKSVNEIYDYLNFSITFSNRLARLHSLRTNEKIKQEDNQFDQTSINNYLAAGKKLYLGNEQKPLKFTSISNQAPSPLRAFSRIASFFASSEENVLYLVKGDGQDTDVFSSVSYYQDGNEIIIPLNDAQKEELGKELKIYNAHVSKMHALEDKAAKDETNIKKQIEEQEREIGQSIARIIDICSLTVEDQQCAQFKPEAYNQFNLMQDEVKRLEKSFWKNEIIRLLEVRKTTLLQEMAISFESLESLVETNKTLQNTINYRRKIKKTKQGVIEKKPLDDRLASIKEAYDVVFSNFKKNSTRIIKELETLYAELVNSLLAKGNPNGQSIEQFENSIFQDILNQYQANLGQCRDQYSAGIEDVKIRITDLETDCRKSNEALTKKINRIDRKEGTRIRKTPVTRIPSLTSEKKPATREPSQPSLRTSARRIPSLAPQNIAGQMGHAHPDDVDTVILSMVNNLEIESAKQVEQLDENKNQGGDLQSRNNAPVHVEKPPVPGPVATHASSEGSNLLPPTNPIVSGSPSKRSASQGAPVNKVPNLSIFPLGQNVAKQPIVQNPPSELLPQSSRENLGQPVQENSEALSEADKTQLLTFLHMLFNYANQYEKSLLHTIIVDLDPSNVQPTITSHIQIAQQLIDWYWDFRSKQGGILQSPCANELRKYLISPRYRISPDETVNGMNVVYYYGEACRIPDNIYMQPKPDVQDIVDTQKSLSTWINHPPEGEMPPLYNTLNKILKNYCEKNEYGSWSDKFDTLSEREQAACHRLMIEDTVKLGISYGEKALSESLMQEDRKDCPAICMYLKLQICLSSFHLKTRKNDQISALIRDLDQKLIETQPDNREGLRETMRDTIRDHYHHLRYAISQNPNKIGKLFTPKSNLLKAYEKFMQKELDINPEMREQEYRSYKQQRHLQPLGKDKQGRPSPRIDLDPNPNSSPSLNSRTRKYTISQ